MWVTVVHGKLKWFTAFSRCALINGLVQQYRIMRVPANRVHFSCERDLNRSQYLLLLCRAKARVSAAFQPG